MLICSFYQNFAATELVHGVYSYLNITLSDFNQNDQDTILQSENSTLSVYSSLFQENFASDRRCVQASSSTVDVNRSFFSRNIASRGSAVFTERSSLSIDNCTFEDNEAENTGGALRLDFSEAEILDCILIHNSAAVGGAVASLSSSITISASKFDKNTARESGGAFASRGSDIHSFNCSYSENSAWINAGAILLEQSSTIVFEFATISGNTAAFGGGLFAYEDSEVWLNFSNIFMNNAVQGAGVYCFRFPIMTSSTFKDNAAETNSQFPREGCQSLYGSGGDIFISGSCYMDEKLVNVMYDNVFIQNQAENFGGAVAFECASSLATLLLMNSTRFHFEANVALAGPNLGSPAQSLSLYTIVNSKVIVNQRFSVFVEARDVFNQTANLDFCSLSLQITSGNEVFSLSSEFDVLSGPPPYNVSTKLGFSDALFVPPLPIFSSNAEIVPLIKEVNLEASSLLITVLGCDPGQILVASIENSDSRL